MLARRSHYHTLLAQPILSSALAAIAFAFSLPAYAPPPFDPLDPFVPQSHIVTMVHDAIPKTCGELVKNFSNRLPAGEYLLREHRRSSRPFFEVLSVTEFPGTELTARVYRREIRYGFPRWHSLMSQNPLGADWHYSQVEHIIRFATTKYRERRARNTALLTTHAALREAWSEEFINEIATLSRPYINDTIYVEVVDRQTQQTVGCMRFISAPYSLLGSQKVATGKVVQTYYSDSFPRFREPYEIQPDNEVPMPPRLLPEAFHLGIELPHRVWRGSGGQFPQGVDIELSLYVIDETLEPLMREQIAAELGVHLLRFAFDFPDDGLNYYGRTFHTYADRRSMSLYLPIGFRPLRDYKLDGKVVTFEKDADAPKILVDGVKWTPLYQSPTGWDETNRQIYDATLPKPIPPAYFQGRILLPGSGSRGYGPETLPVWKPILDSIESEDPRKFMPAVATIIRFADLEAAHQSVMNQEFVSEEQRRHAKANNEALIRILEKVEAAIKEKMITGDLATRGRLLQMAPVLAQASRNRQHLRRDFILKEILLPAFRDPAPNLGYQAFHLIRQIYTPAEIIQILSGAETYRTPSEIREIRADAKARLDELCTMQFHPITISHIRELLQTTWRSPIGMAAIANPTQWENPQLKTVTATASLQLASAGNLKIIELIFLVAACEALVLPF
jgi:hypothetical protein